MPKTRSEEKRWSSEVRKRLPERVAGTAQPTIANALASEGLAAAIRVEDDKLFIDYEATATGSGYVAPSVMLEFGARSTGEPASLRNVICDASGLAEDVVFPTARPRVMHAERTFWEKATAIHVFCLQERLRGHRFDPAKFLRVHRSTIVNFDHLSRAEPAGGGRMLAHMATGESVQVSRAGAQLLRAFIV